MGIVSPLLVDVCRPLPLRLSRRVRLYLDVDIGRVARRFDSLSRSFSLYMLCCVYSDNRTCETHAYRRQTLPFPFLMLAPFYRARCYFC